MARARVALTIRGEPDYISICMRKSFAAKILSVLAVGIVLAHLSPVAIALELCIGDGTDPNCCRNPHSAQGRVDETTHLLDDSDCSCCITVEAVPSTAGATSQKALLDLLSDQSSSVMPPHPRQCTSHVWEATIPATRVYRRCAPSFF